MMMMMMTMTRVALRTIMGQILTSFRSGPEPPRPPVGCATASYFTLTV